MRHNNITFLLRELARYGELHQHIIHLRDRQGVHAGEYCSTGDPTQEMWIIYTGVEELLRLQQS